MATELSRTKGSIRQKEGRISSLKSQLEDTVNKNHNLMKDLGLKSEKIKSLEKK